MKQFKQFILDNLNNIQWMYEKNANGEYDPKANYKGSSCEIEKVFHKAFADALIDWRKEKMSNWKGWVTIGTLTTPAGVSSPFSGTSTCSMINCPQDANLENTMRMAFSMPDPNMKFQHLKVFQAINTWLSSCLMTIYLDGSSNLTFNPAPAPILGTMLLTNASVMESELTIASQKDGFSKEDYWEIFSKYLELSISTSPQTPVVMTGMFNGNMFNGTCTPIL